MRRFRGEETHKVDAKGRVSIPSSFRRVIETCDPNWEEGKDPEFVIVYGDHRRNYLDCYTMEAINEIDDKISKLPRGTKQRSILERLFNGLAHTVSVDKTGRIVLPLKLRNKIKLENQAYFTASGDKFQIWHPDTYANEGVGQIEAWLDQQDDDFDPLIFLDDTERE